MKLLLLVQQWTWLSILYSQSMYRWKPEGKTSLDRPTRRLKNLNINLKQIKCMEWTKFACLTVRNNGGFCIFGNEPSDSIKCGGFPEHLTASQGLCSVQLVTESTRLQWIKRRIQGSSSENSFSKQYRNVCDENEVSPTHKVFTVTLTLHASFQPYISALFRIHLRKTGYEQTTQPLNYFSKCLMSDD
jgi:hypothetical protein